MSEQDDDKMAEASLLLGAGAMTIGKQQAENEQLKAELDRAIRARDVACFNITELNDRRQKLMDTLETALRLIEYLLDELRATGVIPSPACMLAKKTLDEAMARLIKIEDKPRA
jgi:hypothetical protein